MNENELNEWLDNEISDLIGNFFYYDRKGDEEMNIEGMQNCIKSGVITKEKLIPIFIKHISNQFKTNIEETKKTWLFEMIQHSDNSITVSRTNDGFNVIELIGLLETTLKELHNTYNKIFEQSINVVNRTVITK